MESSLIVFALCFLCQILPRTCSSSSSEPDWNDKSVSSDVEQAHVVSAEDTDTIPQTHDRPPAMEDPEYEAEKKAGDPTDLFGSNPHHSYPTKFNDFGRRFVPMYPYTEVTKDKNENDELVPIKETPEKVFAVAIKSAMDRASMPVNNSEAVKKENDILRTGDYWNALWVEDVDPKSVLRSYKRNKMEHEKQKLYTSSAQKLRSVKAKIMPGSKLYQLVSVLQQFSPRLLYVINNKQ